MISFVDKRNPVSISDKSQKARVFYMPGSVDVTAKKLFCVPPPRHKNPFLLGKGMLPYILQYKLEPSAEQITDVYEGFVEGIGSIGILMVFTGL
jgi:hypothetical protein